MDFLIGVIASTIGSLVIISAGFISRKTIWTQLRTCYFKIINVEISVSLIHIRNYPTCWYEGINDDTFNTIRDRHRKLDRLTRLTWNEGVLTIESEQVGTQVRLWLNEEINVAGEGDEYLRPSGYAAIVETGNSFRLGLRHLHRIQHLSLLSQEMQDVVRTNCFSNEEPTREFLVCKLKMPKELVKFDGSNEDAYSSSRATLVNGNLSITCSEPKYIMTAMQAYTRA